MYKKLVYFGILVFLVPLIFVLEYKYITGLGWFGIEVMPGVQFHGIQFFLCLLVIAAIMFMVGLVHPKYSIWFGEKTRRRSSTLYGIAMGIAVAGLIEVNLIALVIYEYEDRTMISFYEDIEIGDPVDEVRSLSESLNKHMGYSYSLLQTEKDLIAYDQNGNFVGFSYPQQFRRSRMRMVVETSLHPGHEDARIVGKYLLQNYRVARSDT